MAGDITSATSAKCSADASILLVIDVQENLGAAMPGKVLNRVVNNSALLARSAGLLDVPVFATEQYPRGLGPTINEISEALPASSSFFEKTVFSCANAEGFGAALQNSARQQVILVGMEAHVCVLQTAFDLLSDNHEVYVVEDAICSRRLENYQNALERMRQCGVHVVSAESVIFEWLADAKHQHFKAVQKMLR
ncbi:MAG: nicotinamidase-related amidase [Gammaproteobacteria bacterium]|jgi:nicotinamidase-related amidase